MEDFPQFQNDLHSYDAIYTFTMQERELHEKEASVLNEGTDNDLTNRFIHIYNRLICSDYLKFAFFFKYAC